MPLTYAALTRASSRCVTEAERRAAWKRIQSAAKRYGVERKRPPETVWTGM